MKIFINDEKVIDLFLEKDATIRIEIDDSNKKEMDAERFVWLMIGRWGLLDNYENGGK